MAGTFGERISELKQIVGAGTLKGSVEVDQIYAMYQHESVWLHHPHGGQAKYLETPLMIHYPDWYGKMASRCYEPDGLQDEMINAMRELVKGVEEYAPREFGNLRHSGHAVVENDGAVVFDQPPEVPRLSEAEIRAEYRRR